jgi:hypothetical protein
MFEISITNFELRGYLVALSVLIENIIRPIQIEGWVINNPRKRRKSDCQTSGVTNPIK